jgi:hypothetical protein
MPRVPRTLPNLLLKIPRSGGIAVCLLAAGLPACGPNMNAIANRLREQTIKQDREIADLKEKLASRDATVAQLQGQVDARLPRVETLPADRLNVLFTAAKLQIRPQTDSWEFESGKGLAGFRVFFRTLAEDGTIIPATGELEVEAFELGKAPAAPRRLGTWKFTAAELKKSWYSGMGLNQFAVNCPWDKGSGPPTARDVAFRLHFTDALTGRVLDANLDKKVTLPPVAATKPSISGQK